jgi:hypothetical protein
LWTTTVRRLEEREIVQLADGWLGWALDGFSHAIPTVGGQLCPPLPQPLGPPPVHAYATPPVPTSTITAIEIHCSFNVAIRPFR